MIAGVGYVIFLDNVPEGSVAVRRVTHEQRVKSVEDWYV